MSDLECIDSDLTLRFAGGLIVRFVVDFSDTRVNLVTANDLAEPVGEVVGVSQGRPRCRLFGRFVAELHGQRGEIREAAQLRYDEVRARSRA